MNDLDNREAWAIVDHALHTFPIASPPPTLSKKIIERVLAQAQPRFHLSWFDYVLSACGAGAASVVLLILQTLPPQVIASTGLQSTILVDRLLFDLLTFATTGCWPCAH